MTSLFISGIKYVSHLLIINLRTFLTFYISFSVTLEGSGEKAGSHMTLIKLYQTWEGHIYLHLKSVVRLSWLEFPLV
jgi:hypothetical protein